MTFQMGDKVRAGNHAGIVTDVGTILIQVETDEGFRRIYCPWELVRIWGGAHDRLSAQWRCAETRRSRR